MSSLSAGSCRDLFAGSRIARFATVTPAGAPHLVPVTCALGRVDGVESIVFAVDHKPKRTTALRRLANLATEPRASFLVDAYSEDWTELWWVRADVTAMVITDGDGPDGDAPGGETPDGEGPGGGVPDGRSSRVGTRAAETHRAAIDLLVAKYPQYRARRPAGAVVLATVTRWTGWSAAPAAGPPV